MTEMIGNKVREVSRCLTMQDHFGHAEDFGLYYQYTAEPLERFCFIWMKGHDLCSKRFPEAAEQIISIGWKEWKQGDDLRGDCTERGKNDGDLDQNVTGEGERQSDMAFV